MSLAYSLPQQVHEETFMDKTLSLVLIFLFMSACATVIEDKDSQTDKIQTAAVPAPEIPVEAASRDSIDEPKQLPRALNRTLSKQEIRSLQSQLKAVGFDPGPSDGVLGAKTTSALRRLQLGCANLKDLLENPDFEMFQQTAGMQTGKQSMGGKTFRADEIRLIQVRLKEAGFDGGPIDGVMGSRTKSALLRSHSGCTMVKDLPSDLKSESQTADRLPSPAAVSERQPQAQSKSFQALAPNKHEAGKVNVGTDKSPGRDEVRLLQADLKAAGFDPGPLDGLLGPKTQSALQQYRVFQGSRKPISGIGLKY
jgi:peptidoglycan hydrolase-like protein with peptidoglycan-binding domain